MPPAIPVKYDSIKSENVSQTRETFSYSLFSLKIIRQQTIDFMVKL